MDTKTVTHCTHPGAPPDEIIDLVADAVNAIAKDDAFLQRKGLTAQDFEFALPAAIQRIRGSAAASNADRRDFLAALFEHMVASGTIDGFETPEYGKATIYRLQVNGIGSVAIIQKGCPDGEHSSVNWSAPEWAQETYLWWLCDSLQYEPGQHVAKGVNRLRKRFFADNYHDSVDGIIFHNAMCGGQLRPCPKMINAIDIGGRKIPPPCVWIMPERVNHSNSKQTSWNWSGDQSRGFPIALLSTFGIKKREVPHFIGHVGFLKGGRGTRTTISSRSGAGASTIYRSKPC